MKKRSIFLALALVFAMLLTGCSGFLNKGVSTDSIAALVTGQLESYYHDNVTDEYASLLGDGTTADDLHDSYEFNVDYEANYFMSLFQIDTDYISQDTYDRAVNLYRQIYAYSKFEIGSVSKQSDSDKYLVDVTVYPIDIVVNFYNEDAEAAPAEWDARVDAGEFNDGTQEAFEEAWADHVLTLFENRLSDIGYLDPTTISVQVIKDEDDGLYYVETTDLQRIDQYMISYDV